MIAVRSRSCGGVGTSPVLVLPDMNLPRMGCVELLREMREDASLRKVPVVVLSSSDEERRRLDAQSFAVSGYIDKPVTLLGFMAFFAVTTWMIPKQYLPAWFWVNLVVSFLHYAYDGMIWKRPKPAAGSAPAAAKA